jgi:tetratricopeptide (TPR) repeat protein
MRLSALKLCAPLAAIALSIASSPYSSAQTSPAKAPDYAAESIVLEHIDSDYTFAADGTGTFERTIASRIQSEAAVRSLGVITMAFAANSQHVDFVYARVRHPDGSVVETDVTGSLEMPAPVTREAPFYSDLKEKQLPIRSLRVGDTLEWKARVTTTKSETPGHFWGQENFVEDAVVLDQTVELRVPAGVSVSVWSPKAKPVESTANGIHLYRWTTSNLKPTAGKEAEAAAEAKKKTLWTADQELDAEQGKLPTIAWTTFHSWEEVGAWYRALSAERATPTAEVRAKVAELVAGKTTDADKVRALYAYVSTQIRYIGVAFGVGRYQPHAAAEILSNQYGDCKDKHTLLASMLAAAGIQSDAVLIGAGVRFNPDVPSPEAFNHLITHLAVSPAPGQPAQSVWLDTTEEVAPYRMLLSILRDRQALIVPGTGPAHLDRTPSDPPFPTVQTWKVTGSLDKNGVSTSRITYTTRGDEELFMRAALRQIAPAQYSEAIQRVSLSMGYQGTTSNPEFSSVDDTQQPLTWSYDYRREQGGDWDNLKIVPQTKVSTLPLVDDKTPPVQSIDLGWPRTETSIAEMKIPEGWGVVVPEAIHAKSSFATLDESYRFDKGTLYTTLNMVVLKQKLPAADWKTYKKWTEDAGLNTQVFIQLVRHDGGASTSTASTPADPASANDAAKLIQQAYADVEKNDLDNAKKLVDEARALSPEHEYLWNTTGYLALHRGDTTEALADFKKEIALHPSAYRRMYPVIVNLQMTMDQHKEAEDSLRLWCQADPGNIAPAVQLLSILIQDEDGKTAVTDGEAALARLPSVSNLEPIHLMLGQAYLLAGEQQKGAAMLTALLHSTQNPGILNDSAYSLADASLELPLAESSARTALDKLADESNSWTLDEDPNLLFVKTRLIEAAWDTLGWIYFREGKLEEAQSYLQAAWLNDQQFDAGKHYGEVLLARGKRPEALSTYELAIESGVKYNGMGVREEASDKMKKLQAVVDALHAGKPGASGSDPALQSRTATNPPTKQTQPKFSNQRLRPTVAMRSDGNPEKLQTLRTIQLGPAGARSGAAQYRILLREGKFVRALPMEQKTIPGAEDLLAKVSFARYFPAGSQSSLVRLGFVNCHSGICELHLAN